MTVFDVSKMGTFTQLLTVSSLLTQVSKMGIFSFYSQ
nr:MAG TPA: hypothetical protein [Caudoviricetes sp.]